MRNHAKLHALTVLALAITACQGGSGALTVEDLAVIRQVTTAWQFHVGAADWESLMVVYTDNAVVMPPNGPTLHGHDAIKTFMAGFPRSQTSASPLMKSTAAAGSHLFEARIR